MSVSHRSRAKPTYLSMAIGTAGLIAIGLGVVYATRSPPPSGEPAVSTKRTARPTVAAAGEATPAPIEQDVSEKRTPPPPVVVKRAERTAKSEPGIYGEIDEAPSTDIPSVVDKSVLTERPWENKDFSYIHTALHPGVLLRAKNDRIVFFEGADSWGLGQPSFLVYKKADGSARGSTETRIAGSQLGAPWLIASFAGSAGFSDWDAPWLFVLQKRPASVERRSSGLTFSFPSRDTGHILAMPLFGYYKPPQKGKEFLAPHGMPSKNIRTWTWRDGLPGDVQKLCEFWSGTARAFPYSFDETFSVDRLEDSITIHQRHAFLTNEDEWNTKPVKFCAAPPTLGLAHQGGTFPLTFSDPVHDPDCMTAYGPVIGVVDRDEFSYTMRVLQYVNEKEKHKEPNTDDPIVAAAVGRLRKDMKDKFRTAGQMGPYDHGGKGNYCWCIMGDCWYAKVLPHVDEVTAHNVKTSLREYFSKMVLREETYDPHKNKLLLHGPGIGSWGTWGDAGKFSMNAIHTIWCYAHYTGDWDLIRERWGVIKKLFITTEEMRWASVGRMAIAEMGDEAEPAIAYARLAWKVGDVDEYNYACYVAAKEFVHHYVKQIGHEYFRRHQPYHGMKPMPPEVFLTNLWGSTAGWQIDGLKWAPWGGEHQSSNRWVRFHSEDVGRFYRDVLPTEVQKEMDDPVSGPGRFEGHVNKDDSHILPSFVRVRSLILNESPEKLAKWARPSEIGGPTSGVVASLFSFIRTGSEIEQERLIPASGDPSPFVQGRERESDESLVTLTVANEGGRGEWFRPAWHHWKSPSYPAGTQKREGWSFGRVVPFEGKRPMERSSWPLSWAGRAVGMNAAVPREIPNEEAVRARQSKIPFKIVGPFPNVRGAGRTKKYGPELAAFSPNAKFPGANGATWRDVTSQDGRVSLKEHLSPHEHVCGYAITAVESPDARDAMLMIGSDDGVQVWLDGELVHDHAIMRGVNPDEDIVAVKLRAGWNRIMFKVDQGDGGWGLYLRVAHPDERPFADIEFSADASVLRGAR